MKRHRYSECFLSIQGEGHYIGAPSVFLRLWGCNFMCCGFPCDTAYSWHRDFRPMSKQETAPEICERIETLCPSFQPTTHLVLTGGEPMLSQTAIAEIIDTLGRRDNRPHHVTIETNGTQVPRQLVANAIGGIEEWFWSVSPKLSASGEDWSNAIKPEVVAEYAQLSDAGQLKYVVDGSERCWDEVEAATEVFRAAGVTWNVWALPLGATAGELTEHQERICMDAVKRGYHFSPRAHVWIFGNRRGT